MTRFWLLLLLSTSLFATEGTWTTYYTDAGSVVNGDGSITILSPTVTVSGNDGGWCSGSNGMYGYDTPAVMLNNNGWARGYSWDSGDPYQTIEWSYTFPNVTLPANGSTVDLSYASTVHGTCFSINDPEPAPPYTQAAFFGATFVDGTLPNISPAPCWILDNFSPACRLPWPSLWSFIPHHLSNVNLNSQKISQKRSACPTAVTLNTLTPEDLTKVFPTFKTGLGGYARMVVTPAMPAGAKVTETLSAGAYTCPQIWKNTGLGCYTHGTQTTGTLTIGTSYTTADETSLSAIPNVVWDEHVVRSTSSLYDLGGNDACTMACNQQYSCGGTSLNSYTVTFSFSKGTINNTPVTNVSVTKQ